MSSTDSDTDPLARWSTTITLGAGKDHAVWSERQVFTWPEMAPRLTQHLPGLKDGLCYTPATFSGTRRQKLDAECIGVAALDIESGVSLETVAKAIRKLGLAAAIASTFRHMMTETKVSAADFARFEEKTGTAEAPSRYLIERKGMLPAIAVGAVVMDQAEKTITLWHKPCPRFRVVLPLARPWMASGYPDRFAALGAWSGAVAALAHALNVQADPSGFEAAHLFYWPRYQPEGVPPASLLIAGKPVDIFSLPPAPRSTRTYAPRRAAVEVAPDLPENVTEARRWLTSEAPVAVERRQGDKTTYRVACELHDRGISETLAFDMMTDGWNARCDPPWQHDDLETKVRNAYRYADNDFGCKSSRSAGQAAFGHVKLPETGEPTRLDWDWWLSRPLTPPEPMLGHFITTGAFLFIGGPTGEGKTQLAMAIAGALVTNTKLMHWQCHGVRRVLIIDGEMPNALTQQRLRDLHRRLGSPRGAPLHLLARDDFPAMKPLNTEAGREFIMRKIEEIRPDLIVFDSRMCLTLGELRDEKTWASTLPLVLEIRHRKIAQIWIDHMGLIADHLYGDKTKEWTADIVALMLAMSKEDKLRAGSTVHFRLEIAKARTRTPDIGDDFRDGIVTLKDDAWSFTADGDKPAGKVPKWCQSFYKALLTVLGDGHNITAPTWQAECERRNFIPSPPEEETYAQRSTRLSTFRAAKSRLAQIGAIDMFGDFVHCAKTWR